MKKIILAGLIFDTNLGDPAIYEATRGMVQDYDLPLEVDTIDLYGRKSFRDSFFIKIRNKVQYKLGIGVEKIILKDLKKEINRKLSQDVSAVIFVGGGLIKYKHQFISKPVSLLIEECDKRNIPVMLSAVGVEGYDSSDECQEFKKYLNRNCVKRISTRDDIITLKNHYIYNRNIKCSRVADPAVSIANIYTPSEKKKNIIGLGVGRRGLFSDYENDVSDEQIKKFWIQIYLYFVEKGYEPIFFTNGLMDDYEFAKEIANELNAKIIDNPKSLEELCNFISTLNYAVVTRLHSSILCYSYSIPSISLVWNNKQMLFGELTNQSEYFMLPKSFSIDSFKKLFSDLEEKKVKVDLDFMQTTQRELFSFLDEWL